MSCLISTAYIEGFTMQDDPESFDLSSWISDVDGAATRKRNNDDDSLSQASSSKQPCTQEKNDSISPTDHASNVIQSVPKSDPKIGTSHFIYTMALPPSEEHETLKIRHLINRQNIDEQMRIFLRKFQGYTINNPKNYYGERIVLYDALNDVNLYLSVDIPISINDLHKLFATSGHALYISLNHNYVVPLVLSLTCIKCKNNECYEKPENHLDTICSSIWQEINTFLDISIINFRKHIMPCTRNHNCDLLIYLNLSVSITVYSYIINMLNNSQSESMRIILDKYHINYLNYVPLPYLIKSDNDMFTLHLKRQDTKSSLSIFPCMTNYVDFRLQVSNDVNLTKDLILAKIIYNYSSGLAQHLYHDEVSQEWDITDKVEIETVYVTVVMQDDSQKQLPTFEIGANGIPAFIRSRRKYILESVNENFNQLAHNLLKENHTNNISANSRNNHLKFLFVHTDTNELEHKILTTLDSIGRNIARHVYQVETSNSASETPEAPPIVDPDDSKNDDSASVSQTEDSGGEANINGSNETYNYVGYLIQLCYEPDETAGYAFYVIILSIMYTMQKLSISANDRAMIITMLRKIVMIQQNTDNKQLIWILNSLVAVNCMSELGRIFPEPLRILKNLATSIFMRRRVETKLTEAMSSTNLHSVNNLAMCHTSLVTSTSISYEVLLFDELCRLYLHEELAQYVHLSDLMLEEIVTSIFRRYLIIFYRNINSNNVMYMYKDPLYIEHKMSSFVSDNTANSKLRFMYDKLLMYVIPILRNKTGKESNNETKHKHQAIKIIKNAWYNYVNEHIPVKNVHFGKYRYFVCTLRGIFNNITGLYMCGIPQLYFENASSFCILPPLGIGDISINTSHNSASEKKFCFLNDRAFNNMSIITAVDDVSGHNYHSQLREINDELINRIEKWKKHVHVYIMSQDKLFYLSVMVPGLLKIGESVFNKQTRILMITTLTDRIKNDNNANNHEELFYLLPVMQYYSFDCNSIMAMARCIDRLMNEKHISVTSRSISKIIHTIYHDDIDEIYEEIGGKCQQRFGYERHLTANDFYEGILGNFTYRPNRRTFALAFIWILIEWDNNEDDFISTKFEIQRHPFDYLILKEALDAATPDDKISVTLRGDPFGLTQYPLNLHKFTCETNENFRRAFDITFQSMSPNIPTITHSAVGRNQVYKHSVSSGLTSKQSLYPLDLCMYNAFLSISIIFRFDSRTIQDYLTHGTLLFQPFNNCRKFTLYYGEPRCGKSYLANLIIRAAEPSVFNVLSDLTTAASAASPSPDLIKAFQSYVVCIKEVRKLAESLLKTITGEDHMDQRDLYKGYQKLTPICFIFGCTNQIPQIDADEAVKDRLSIFHFINRIEPCYNFRDSIDDNQLLLFINECTIQPQTEEFATSIGLYNTFYAMFSLVRNHFGLVVPTITNYASKQIMKKFLIHNSLMYSIIDECGIEVCVGYSIKLHELKSLAERTIEKSKRAIRNNYHVHDFMSDFAQHFRKFRVRNKVTSNDEFVGVGLPPTDNSQVNIIDVIFNRVKGHICRTSDPEKNLPISEIRKLIQEKVKEEVRKSDGSEVEYITPILLRIKSVYHESYDIENKCFRKLQIRHSAT